MGAGDGDDDTNLMLTKTRTWRADANCSILRFLVAFERRLFSLTHPLLQPVFPFSLRMTCYSCLDLALGTFLVVFASASDTQKLSLSRGSGVLVEQQKLEALFLPTCTFLHRVLHCPLAHVFPSTFDAFVLISRLRRQ